MSVQYDAKNDKVSERELVPDILSRLTFDENIIYKYEDAEAVHGATPTDPYNSYGSAKDADGNTVSPKTVSSSDKTIVLQDISRLSSTSRYDSTSQFGLNMDIKSALQLIARLGIDPILLYHSSENIMRTHIYIAPNETTGAILLPCAAKDVSNDDSTIYTTYNANGNAVKRKFSKLISAKMVGSNIDVTDIVQIDSASYDEHVRQKLSISFSAPIKSKLSKDDTETIGKGIIEIFYTYTDN